VVSPQKKANTSEKGVSLRHLRRAQGRPKKRFAQEFLPKYAEVVHFVDADLIASGLFALQPELAAIKAGRLLVNEIDRLAGSSLEWSNFEPLYRPIADAWVA